MGRGQEILYHKDVYFPEFDFKRFWSNIFRPQSIDSFS